MEAGDSLLDLPFLENYNKVFHYRVNQMITKEIFLDIPEYEGLYQVSNLGNIKSLPKSDGNGYKERLLKFEKYKSKLATYFRVSLSKNGTVKRFFVHRLVASLFVPNPDNNPQVNHIDHDSTNNIYSNLEWVTGKQNMAASTKLGRQDKPRTLGCIAASKNNQSKAEAKYKAMLKKRFIKTYTKQINGKTKRFVDFHCICGNTYSERVDNAPLRIRNGICNHCKDEDIV